MLNLLNWVLLNLAVIAVTVSISSTAFIGVSFMLAPDPGWSKKYWKPLLKYFFWIPSIALAVCLAQISRSILLLEVAAVNWVAGVIFLNIVAGILFATQAPLPVRREAS